MGRRRTEFIQSTERIPDKCTSTGIPRSFTQVHTVYRRNPAWHRSGIITSSRRQRKADSILEQHPQSSRKELLCNQKRATSCNIGCKHFRPYLYGKEFNLSTDNASLIWLYKRRDPAHQITRWLEILAAINFNIQRRKKSQAYKCRWPKQKVCRMQTVPEQRKTRRRTNLK